MGKIAVVTDSNSGVTQQKAKELNLHILPMPFLIDGIEYFEDITLTQEEFYKKLLGEVQISTSQPSPGSVMSLWEELLNEYDQIVHIPMSSELSFSCPTAVALAEEYDGRVQVVDNLCISVTQRQAALNALELAKKGMSAQEIKQRLESMKLDNSLYIMLNTLKYLKKGGRLTPAAATIGSILRIKPILKIDGGKLDAYAKAPNVKQGRAMIIDAVRNDLNTRFSSLNMRLQIAYTYDESAALGFAEEVKEAFPNHTVRIDPLSLSVACHIGPGAIALTATRTVE